MAAKAPETHYMQTFGQLLEQCHPDDIPEMIARLKTKLARHRQALNLQHSLLLTEMPTELILLIGERVLGVIDLKSNKAWFRRVLPLLQTCVQLRAQLRPLFSTPLVHEVIVSVPRMYDEALKALAKWREDGPRRVRDILIVNYKSGPGLKLSTAAAVAGALEGAIYGSLSSEPAVYVRCVKLSVQSTGLGVHHISHCRENNMIGEAFNLRKGRSFRYIDKEEAKLVWIKARQNGWD